jgi:hypothetical protein
MARRSRGCSTRGASPSEHTSTSRDGRRPVDTADADRTSLARSGVGFRRRRRVQTGGCVDALARPGADRLALATPWLARGPHPPRRRETWPRRPAAPTEPRVRAVEAAGGARGSLVDVSTVARQHCAGGACPTLAPRLRAAVVAGGRADRAEPRRERRHRGRAGGAFGVRRWVPSRRTASVVEEPARRGRSLSRPTD